VRTESMPKYVTAVSRERDGPQSEVITRDRDSRRPDSSRDDELAVFLFCTECTTP
jgi:hypothetical protein